MLAYRYLNRREQTTSEVRAHLVARGAEPEVAEAVVAELIEQRTLDDARFARLFVQDKRALGHWGRERIRRGLESRGVERALADAALAHDDHDSDPDRGGDGELARALALLRSRFPSPARECRERERALGLLLRKGYEYELALDAIRADRADRA